MGIPAEGRRVLITRSEPGASRLAEVLQAAGWAIEKLPLLRIEPVRDADLELASRRLELCTIFIFTSVHAVAHGFDVVARSRSGARPYSTWIAVGSATAAALRERSVEARVPGIERSEGILAMPELGRVEGVRIAIVGGVGGRRILDAELAARGADVVRLTVYRRVDAAWNAAVDPETLAAVVVSSAAGAESLVDVLTRAGGSAERLAGVPMVVPSARVARAVSALGFGNVLVSEGAGAEAVLAVLATIRGDRHGE